ncbi:hypothetical protein HNQ75_004407 [Rhizobium flavum]|uniref:FecR protein domain-containing protein n=1 Tax=Pseudorhizobium flavum TaxID=1335061 RepID=A0A7X0DEW1_9HYPH|nr:FecR domain-containing protein [Pseudorhizobium flavum]MBB6182418.1 hypothetical protein [Pseudorhizobium flavum]CAD6599313.1 membrane protein [Pseudorhizobium flavum]
MPRIFRSIPFAALMMLCFSAAGSLASEWLVSRTTQQVSFTVDKKTWVPVVGGMTIPNRSWISTGPRGRVQLERGVEKVSFGPKTLAAIITENGLFSRKTEVVQQKGEIALNIEKRSRPHTYVHTPFLAAVVKGTTFTVTVSEKAASVSVDEGLVQVSSFTGGQSTNVGPGQQVTVDHAQSMSVAGITETPAVFSVEPTQAFVPAVGQPAPVGAGLGLGTFSDQGSTGPSSNGGSIGVNGESSGGGNSLEQPMVDNNGNVGGSGNGNDGKGPGGKGPDDKGPGGKGPGDKGPGGKGPGDKGPGGKGPDDKGPGGKGPGDKGPGGKGPDDKGPGGKGPDDKGPGGKGPGDKVPGGKGPDDKGPGGKGPDDKGPGGKGPDDKGPGGKGNDGNSGGKGNDGKGPGGKGNNEQGRGGKGNSGKDDD